MAPPDASKVQAIIFMPHVRDTSMKLKRGETLFCLTDRGLSECPNSGPDDVLVVTEEFGCWPVVAFTTAHAEEWRRTTSADHLRMMQRVRQNLRPQAIGSGNVEA